MSIIISPSEKALKLPYRIFLFFLISISAVGCVVGDFVGAYFNTYYNAQKLFDEAESEVLTFPEQKSSQGKLFLAPFSFHPPTKTKFTLVIEKCSKLLQYHPESALVDDALLMIGKSYYYSNEYSKAERKFSELISAYPKSDLVFEARVLLANTYYKLDEKQSARKEATSLIADASKAHESYVEAKCARLLGELAFEDLDYNTAREYFDVAGQLSEFDTQRSAAHRRSAEMYILQRDFRKAHDSYTKADDASSTLFDEYQSKIGRIRSLTKLGEYTESLAELDELLGNSVFRDFYGEMDLEVGNVYRDMGKLDEAIDHYKLIDTTYARTEVAAKAAYELGLIYETKLFDLDSARVVYNKGKLEFPQALVSIELSKRSEYLNKYYEFKSEMVRYDSIKAQLLRPKTVALSPVDSLDADTTSVEKSQTPTPLPTAVQSQSSDNSLDSVYARQAYYTTEIASLFYTAFGFVDSAEVWFKKVLTDYPTSVHAARALFTLAHIYGQNSTIPLSVADSLRQETIRLFPSSEFANESRKAMGVPQPTAKVDSAESIYRRAETFLSKRDTAQALLNYRTVVSRFDSSTFAPRAQYAIAWLYEQIPARSDSAISNYRKLIVKFPSSQFTIYVAMKLAEVDAEFQRISSEAAAKKDSLSQPSMPMHKPTIRPSLPPGMQQKGDSEKALEGKTIPGDIVEPPTEKIQEPPPEEDPKP